MQEMIKKHGKPGMGKPVRSSGNLQRTIADFAKVANMSENTKPRRLGKPGGSKPIRMGGNPFADILVALVAASRAVIRNFRITRQKADAA